MPITTKMSKSKSEPEVKFQYGGCLFREPDVVISQPWFEISSKFGMLIAFDLCKCVTSSNAKPEIDLGCCGRHLRK